MANGNFAGGAGTQLDPYLIEDAHDLNAVRNGLNKHYKLIKNVNLNVSPYNMGEGWIPIGYSVTNDAIVDFVGVIDGDGFTISDLYINRPKKNQALVSSLSYASSSMLNINMKNANVVGASDCGILVGLCYQTKTSNCSVSGKVQGTTNVGGLVGQSFASEIANCYSVGEVNGTMYVGGLVGSTSNTSTLKNSFSTCSSISSSAYVGGLIGITSATSIVKCYSSGKVQGTTNVGGLVGSMSSSTQQNSFWDKETSGLATSALGTGLTTLEMQTPQTFINATWDIELNQEGEPIWILDSGKYPRLYFEKNELLIRKYFIKSNSILYTIGENLNILEEITSSIADVNNITKLEYETYGFDNLSDITSNHLSGLERPINLLYYRDGITNTTESPRLRQEYDLNVGVRQMIKKPMM